MLDLEWPEWPEWREFANCRPQPGEERKTELFFPVRGGDHRLAKEICKGCSVTEPCLKFAMDEDLRQGIYGGLSENQRKKIRVILTYDEIMAIRGKEAYDLKLQGLDNVQIAAELGCGKSTTLRRLVIGERLAKEENL